MGAYRVLAAADGLVNVVVVHGRRLLDQGFKNLWGSREREENEKDRE